MTATPTRGDTKSPASNASIAIVGAGPRGISIIERIAAYLNAHSTTQPLNIHLIDDAQHGAGRIWDTTQTHTLCMNTLAGAVTLFTEPGSTVGAPVLEGPIQYEWIKLLRGERDGIDEAKLQLFDSFPPHPSIAEDFSAEIAATKPESNPSRALYGAYLRWALEVALAQLPDNVTVHNHASRATGITQSHGHDVIELADSTTIDAHATVLATGWVAPAANKEEEILGNSGLTWVGPNNPLDQDLSVVPDNSDVLVRGLGMGFFDVMALLTIDRGGKFIEDTSARAGLRYEPTGREPHLYVASGRGYPYLPKSEYHSLPPKANLARLKNVIAEHQDAQPQSIDFTNVVWPAIVRDSYADYYTTLACVRPESLKQPLETILETIDSTTIPQATTDAAIAPNALTAALQDASTEPFVLTDWMAPLSRGNGVHGFTSAELTSRIASSLHRDIQEAVAARNSPLKSGLWAVSAARKPASILGSNGRFMFDTRVGAYKQFMALGQMAGSGPPLFRTRQLLALVDAGLVTFVGDRPSVHIATPEGKEKQQFIMTSGSRTVASTVLIDAWMHQPDVRNAPEGLEASIADRVTPFLDGGNETGSPATDDATRRTIHSDGSLDERLHVAGIPTYSQWPDTTISPMPGTDPLMLQETDKVARSLLITSGVEI
ncbi:FAD/NAD(P)-binding protein [Corynebacterium sp. L4756]|uniref:FAD/NAD(P)-binding protein n=1 Tax=unclassified Corynebacterium TaxID=2624378 RepID=UPI00374D91FD